MRASFRAAPVFFAVLSMAGCHESTGALSREREAQLTAERIRRRADDLVFRFTRDPGRYRDLREDRPASIVVTPRSRRFYGVERERERVRIRSGTGRREEIWSFIPPSDPDGWTADIRAAISGSRSAANR